MKLLIIDDNEAVLRSLKLVFTGVFDRVVTVSNPQLLPALLSAGDVDAVLLCAISFVTSIRLISF